MTHEHEETALELTRLRSAIDRTLTAIMMIDRDLVVTYANAATIKLMRSREDTLKATFPGFSVDKLIGSCIDIFHKDASHQRRLLADPGNLPFSTDIKVADLVFNINVTAQVDPAGNYIGNTLEWHDVTERRQLESTTQDFAAKFDAVSRSQAYIEFDLDGTILTANRNFLDTMGYALDEITARHHSMFVEPDYARGPEYKAFWERLNRGEPQADEFKRIGKGGREVWIQASYSPVLDATGKPYKVVKYASDVTARKLAINRCGEVLAALADGDLTQVMEGTYSGELATLQGSLNETVTRFHDMVARIRAGALSINSAASEVAKGNTELSARTEEQASSLEQTAASMEEMTSTVQQNADNSRQANQLASSARDQASQGGEVVGRAVAAMAAINDSSKKIADIIGVIDEIAFQTNLLALNAAVEAARAGEQGRGFAVVASEVRNLAQRSASAAKEIKALINDSVQKVSEGSKLVDASGATLGEIVNSVKKVSDIIGEIAVASEEQSSGISQVNQAVTQMDQMTQQNAALVEQAAAASESMDEESRALLELIQFFQVAQHEAAAARATPPAVERRSADRPWSSAAPRARATPSHGSARPAPAPAAQAAAGGDVWDEF